MLKNTGSKKRKEYDNKIIDDLVIKAGSKNSREFWYSFNNLMNNSKLRQIETNITPT